MSVPEAQFSIYKINYSAVNDLFHTCPNKNFKKYQNEVSLALINSITASVKKKGGELYEIRHRGIVGVIFKTTHNPAWKNVAQYLLSNNELEQEKKASQHFLTNTNVSYVILCCRGENLYACTGGYGSNYISKFVVKNFGLYLLPKLTGRNNQVLKSVIQNNLIGNQASTNKVNRNTTSFSSEQDMSSIFRQLTVEANRTIAEQLGIVFSDEEPDNKKTNIINKDSLVIRRSFSLHELFTILEKINEIEKKEDLFVLNYMVLAKKKGLKNSDLYKKMVDDFSSGNFSGFILVGDDYEQYYSNAAKYRVTADNEEIIEKDTPITIDDIIPLIKTEEDRITKSSVNNMLKNWLISTEDNSGATALFPTNLFNAMQGFVEFGEDKTPCYLFNGTWFVFDQQYDTLLTKEFNELFDNNKTLSDEIINRWELSHSSKNEDDYNEWLAKRSDIDIIVSHKALMGNVEIADAIFWGKETVYFLHNKASFSGVGARDLTNQILVAAEYFQIHRMAFDAQDFYRRYFREIEEKSKTYKRQLPVSEEEFVSILSGAKNYCFLAGYLTDYKKDSRSTYAKYLSIELKKKLNARGFNCYILGIT